MTFEYEINSFTNVHRDRDFGAVMEKFQLLVLLRRNVNGRGDFLAGHRCWVNLHGTIRNVKRNAFAYVLVSINKIGIPIVS